MRSQPSLTVRPGALALLTALGAATLATGCGGDPCQGAACTSLPDVGQSQDAGPTTDGQSGGDADAGGGGEDVHGGDGSSQRLPMGAPCANSPECLSGFCFKPPEGERFCTMKCFGPCPTGYVCADVGANTVCLVSTACQPDCEGKPCGDDGCGGSCGTCPEGLECVAGTSGAPLCAKPKSLLGAACTQGSTCASGTCAALEAGGETVCAQPCDLLCPVGMRCDLTLSGTTGAPQTTQGLCVPSDCQPDCQAKDCGDDGCGGSCGGCPSGGVCDGGACRDLVCDDVPSVGCCVGEVLHVCASGELKEVDCGLTPHCGWNPIFAGYLCHSDDESDPAGQLPRTCGVDPAGGGLRCAAWAQCAAGCPAGDLWCAQACHDKTVAASRPLVDAIAACNASSSCAWSEPCVQAHCPSSWAECVATAAQ